MSYAMKLWGRVIEIFMRRFIFILENQFGFMPGRFIMKAIHLMRHAMKYYRDRQRDLHMVFIYLVTTHNKVPREVL